MYLLDAFDVPSQPEFNYSNHSETTELSIKGAKI